MQRMSSRTSPWARDQIEQKVRELAAAEAHVPVEKVELNTHLINDLNYDSLMEIELIMKLEDEFDVNLPDNERDLSAKWPKTVVEYVDVVEGKLSQTETSTQH